MATKYVVDLEFRANKSDLNKAISSSTGGSSSGGSSANGAAGTAKESKVQSGFLKTLTKQFAVVGFALLALKQIIEPITEMIEAIGLAIAGPIVTGILDLGKSIGEFIGKIGEFFTAVFQGDFAAALKSLYEGIIGIVNQLAGFDVGKLAYDAFVSSLSILQNVGTWIWESILKPAWEYLADVGVWVWDKIIKPAWDYLASVGEWIWTQILKPAWDYLANVGMWIWDQILKPAWDTLKDVGTWIWDIIKSPFQWLSDAISGVVDWISRKLSFFGNKDGSRAFGGTIPQDGMYKLHAGETVSRGNTTNTSTSLSPVINITVNGSNQNIASQIADAMMLELRRVQRF